MMAHRFKRRRFSVINPSHQYRFLAMIIVYSAIVGGVMAGFVFFPEFNRLQDPQLGMLERAQVADKILTMHARIWPVLISLICIIGLHSFVVFHRFVGPLYRFAKAFEQVEKGQLNFHIQLRQNDYLLEEERRFNRMIDSLCQRVETLQQVAALAVSDFARLQQSQAGPLQPDGLSGMEAVGQHLNRILDLVDQFQAVTQKQETEVIRPSSTS